ncbi:aKG-HExxH-type peptide beta-hydroxylase [Streptomyces iconiensis]|uniref:HEXXH motif-containing putative peptide modification protein n=1 Tax=Streptomyces iconiensis TaxID=1384038 RepID=A0ABT7A1R7_9ACTN|nr:HEXXH motif-containing putative peptide modification protein [Streptomyces iconiensis]MDJ1135262.1 HEXXH motif-containing putative peptide modification protein [Streptomyces iconiensis]
MKSPAPHRWGDARPAAEDTALLRDGLHSTRLLLLKTLLTRAERETVSPRAIRAFRDHWSLLERAEAHDPGAARETLGYPAVGAWLVAALDAFEPEAFEAALSDLGAVAATAASRAGLESDATLPVRHGALTLPGLGGGVTSAPAIHVRVTHEGPRLRAERRPGEAEGADGSCGWRPLSGLPGGVGVLDDRDPYLCAGGDLAGFSPVHLRTSRETRPWLEVWEAALGLLRETDPERAAEVAGLVRALVPVVREEAAGPVSATCWSAPWAVLTTLPGTAEEMAEVLVHEVQHSKLAVLGDLVTLHHGDREAVYSVGWRTDPRPLGAMLQGAYAHLALADLWGRIAARDGVPARSRRTARLRCAEYREQVADALTLLLGSDQLTSEGREFVEGMRRRHGRLGPRSTPITDEPLSKDNVG